MISTSRLPRLRPRRSTNSRDTVSRAAADGLFPKVKYEDEEFPDYPAIARWYCEQVVGGHVPACKWEILGCKRFLAMLAKAAKPSCEYVFRYAPVLDICGFIEKLHHTVGRKDTVVLEPVQIWWLAAIFGFRERDTGLRWVRNASLWVPRKNGKTFLAVGVVLFCTNFEGEPGAEAVISAGSEGQAHVPYDAVRRALAADSELSDHLRAHDTKDFTEFRATGGSIKLATARAKNLDGLNPHLVLKEELHAQDQDVIGVLKTAQGARKAPLDLSISTAGRDVNGAGYEDWKACQAVLEGRLKAERLFTAMYAGDEADAQNRFNVRILEKLNPLWGVSLHPAQVEGEEIFEAKKSEAKLQEYLRTRLNVWTRAAGNLISMDAWQACADPKLDLDVLKGFPMYVGLDLASRQDLNAAAFVVKVGETLYTTGKYWLGRNCPRLKDDRFADAFLGWARDGWLELTDLHEGTFVDFRVILRRVLEMLDGHNVVAVALDDYQANQMASDIEIAGYKTVIVRKNAKSLTPATEDLIARTNNPAIFQHDGNPITGWCAGNVVGHWDANDNVLPKKERKGSTANIDGIDALILANTVRLEHEAGMLGQPDKSKVKPDPYLRRGLIGSPA